MFAEVIQAAIILTVNTQKSDPSYFGKSGIAWAAWTAIGTISLAVATVLATGSAWLQVRNERKRAAVEREADELARHDAEARTVMLQADPVQAQQGVTRRAHVIAPTGFPITDIRCWYIASVNGNISTLQMSGPYGPFGNGGLLEYQFTADAPAEFPVWPLVSFSSWKGLRYFSFQGATRRFGSDIQPEIAWQELGGRP